MARLFISDTHIGNPSNNLEKLHRVLSRKDWEEVYLVGDIFDLDAMNEYGTISKDDQKLISWIYLYLQRGGKVIWLAGNHDRGMGPILSRYIPYPKISFQEEAFIRNTWIVHGDKYDRVYQLFKRFTKWGGGSVGMGFWYNVYTQLGMWRKRIARQTKERDCKTVICGHMHLPEDKTVDGIRYINCGDWMGSSTWVEENQGYFDIFGFKGEQITLWRI